MCVFRTPDGSLLINCITLITYIKILMEEFTASMKWLTLDRTSAHGGQCISVP